MAVSLFKPKINPALYPVRECFGMMNGNDNQMGYGSFTGCNRSQPRQTEQVEKPNFFDNLTALAKIAG
jgi:hypothetical protein